EGGIALKNSKVSSNILAVKLISNVDKSLAENLSLETNYNSVGILTGDADDVLFVALDEATKKSDVDVVYAESMYAGSDNANTKLAGEVIGILAGNNPEEVKSGLDAAINYVENDAYFVSANEDDSILYFAHLISRSGKYLSKYAVDAALKAADTKIASFYGPPSETNFGGAILTGSQSACQAACEAFSNAVNYVANNPKGY